MGGRTLEAMALIGIGIERLSITPAAVAPVKAMVRSLTICSIKEIMETLLARPPADIRATLTEWARENNVEIV
jgi:phosphotransferase system enzyme I (PtsP)